MSALYSKYILKHTDRRSQTKELEMQQVSLPQISSVPWSPPELSTPYAPKRLETGDFSIHIIV